MLLQATPRVMLTFLVILIASAAAWGQSKVTQQYRIIPIKDMSEDVEVLYGAPAQLSLPMKPQKEQFNLHKFAGWEGCRAQRRPR